MSNILGDGFFLSEIINIINKLGYKSYYSAINNFYNRFYLVSINIIIVIIISIILFMKHFKNDFQSLTQPGRSECGVQLARGFPPRSKWTYGEVFHPAVVPQPPFIKFFGFSLNTSLHKTILT